MGKKISEEKDISCKEEKEDEGKTVEIIERYCGYLIEGFKHEIKRSYPYLIIIFILLFALIYLYHGFIADIARCNDFYTKKLAASSLPIFSITI